MPRCGDRSPRGWGTGHVRKSEGVISVFSHRTTICYPPLFTFHIFHMDSQKMNLDHSPSLDDIFEGDATEQAVTL
jgi:hypothetical protein